MGEDPKFSRRRVLKSTAGLATAGVLSHGLGSTVAADGDDPQGFCGGTSRVNAETISVSPDGTCSNTTPWPDDMEDESWIKSVDYPAATVMHMEAGGPIAQPNSSIRDESPMADTCVPDYDPGDPYRVAIFYGDLRNGRHGKASIGPYTIKDSGNQYLPDGEDQADAWVLLDKSPEGYGWADGRVAYHEIGHTLGYLHEDCGLMSTGKVADSDYHNDVGAGYLDKDNTVEIAKRANGIHYIDQVTTQDCNDIITPLYLNDDAVYAEYDFWYNTLEPNNDPVVYLDNDWTNEFGAFVIRLDGYDGLSWNDWYRAGTFVTCTFNVAGYEVPVMPSPWDITLEDNDFDWPNWEQNDVDFAKVPSGETVKCE